MSIIQLPSHHLRLWEDGTKKEASWPPFLIEID